MRVFLTAVVGLALAQSVLAFGDAEQKTLACEETEPVFNQSYVISITGDQVDKLLTRGPNLVPNPNPPATWSVYQGELTVSFSKAIESAGSTITVTEQVAEVDWEKTDLCYTIQRRAHLFVSSNSEAGPYKGTIVFSGTVEHDPSVPDSECIFPRIMPAPQINISCQLL